MSRWHICAQCGASVKGKKYCRTKVGKKPDSGFITFFLSLNSSGKFKPDEKIYFCSESCMKSYAVANKADFIKTRAGRKLLKEANAL